MEALRHSLVFRSAQSNWRDVPPRHDIDLLTWIGGRHVRRGQPELAPNDIAALRDRTRLVKCDFAVAALTAKATVAGHDQALSWYVLQRLADFGGNVFRPICLKR